MEYVYNDGGRAASGYKGKTGDCACRAIAIATGLPYQQVYDRLNELAKSERRRKSRRSNARTGVRMTCMKRFMCEIGWHWHPLMGIGTGCTVHLRSDELPPGRIVVRLSRHYAAVIDGVLHDTYNSAWENRCVYGYFMRREWHTSSQG